MASYLTSLKLYAYLNAGWVELTTDTLLKSGASANWGIDGSGPLDFIAGVGELNFTLHNQSAKYYPGGDSPLSGWKWNVPKKTCCHWWR